VTEQPLLAVPVSSEDDEESDDADGDERQRKVDGEDDRSRGEAFRPLIDLESM